MSSLFVGSGLADMLGRVGRSAVGLWQPYAAQRAAVGAGRTRFYAEETKKAKLPVLIVGAGLVGNTLGMLPAACVSPTGSAF